MEKDSLPGFGKTTRNYIVFRLAVDNVSYFQLRYVLCVDSARMYQRRDCPTETH